MLTQWRHLKAEGVFPGKKPKSRYTPKTHIEGPVTWQHLSWADRNKVIEAWNSGLNLTQVAMLAGISVYSVKKLVDIYENENDLWVDHES